MLWLFQRTSLLASLTCLVIAHIVYQSNRRSRLSLLFGLCSLAVAIWSFSHFMCLIAADLEGAVFWSKVGAILPLCGVLYLHFALYFTERESLTRKKGILLLMYLPPLVFILINMTTNLLGGPPVKKAWGYVSFSMPEAPLFFYIFEVWILVVVGLVLASFISFFRKTANPLKKAQARYFILGLSLPIVFAIVEITGVILNGDFPELSPAVLGWLNGCVAYAIWKYDLFTLGPGTAAENLIEILPDALLLLNPYDQVIKTNHSMLRLSGLAENEILGRPLSRFLAGEAAAVKAGVDREEQISDREVRLISQIGPAVPCLLSGFVIKSRRGKAVGYLFFLHDIRERKKAEEVLRLTTADLERSNRELQNFTHIASHDLKEPLRKILVFTDFLKRKKDLSPGGDYSDYLRRMEQSAIRMQALIEGLLDYSRVTTKARPFSRVDLKEIIGEVLADLEVRIEETQGRVFVSSLPVLYADSLQMRQLFQNLISNALKYHKPGIPPEVTVTGMIEGGKVEIIVADNGIGFEQSQAGRVFDIFQRLVGKSEYEGTGVGLSICKKIVERHGGTIAALSSPGRGTTMRVTLLAGSSEGDSGYQGNPQGVV